MRNSPGGIDMLKRFEVENYRGFSENLVFDLTARDYSFNRNLVYDGIVNKAIIYGKNGIGKSSLGLALFDMVSHLTDKMNLFPMYYRNLDNPEKPVTFKYFFKFGKDEIIYMYQKMENNHLLIEEFTVNGNILIRYDYFDDSEESRYVASELKGTLNIALIDNKLSVLKYIYRNTPTNENSPITKIIKFCENMLWFRSLSDGTNYMGYTNGGKILTDTIYESGKLKQFQKFLYDNGVDYNLKFESENGNHVLYAYYNNGQNKAPFTSLASTGTMSLTLFYSWSILAFQKISFLFIDEFDAFFHYESAEMIIQILNENKNFQSMVTTHNTYLMQNKLTRPDCCFLMTQNKISNLYDATDREIREAHNLEKMYINGAFV